MDTAQITFRLKNIYIMKYTSNMLVGSIPISISIGYLCVSDEYHLFVDQVTLQDDAMFECQVGPAGGDPPLKAQVQLSVISKCPSVCLCARAGMSLSGWPI